MLVAGDGAAAVMRQNQELLPMSSVVFLMCHVPKTAGTTIGDVFSQIYGAENCRVQRQPNHEEYLANFERDVKAGVRFFSGHTPLPELIELKRKHPDIATQLVLSIRNPISHFFSLYLHVQHFSDAPIDERRLRLPTFLRRYTPDSFFHAESINVFCRLLTGNQQAELTGFDYMAARRNLRQVDFIFDGDDLGSSISEFIAKYDASTSVAAKALNTNSYERASLERSGIVLLHRLATKLRFDLSLYAAAARRMGEVNRSTTPHQAHAAKDLEHVIYLSEARRRDAGGGPLPPDVTGRANPVSLAR